MSDTRDSRGPVGRPTIGSGRPSGAGRPTIGASGAGRPGARVPRQRVETGALIARNIAPGTGPLAGGRPAARGGVAPRRGPRRVRLGIARIDPWSVMKVSFLLSVALGIASVVAVMVLWLVLNQMQVFQSLNQVVQDLTAGEGGKSNLDLMRYLGFGRVVSITVVISVADMLIMTALSTLAAFLYNVCTSLVGGVQVTLTDE